MRKAVPLLLLALVSLVLVAGCTAPAGSGAPTGCTVNWQCGNWSACSSAGTQTRTCTDTNVCNTTYGKPAESQTCTPSCTPNWQCGAWSECNASRIQNRICSDINKCNSLTGKLVETQTCEYANCLEVFNWKDSDETNSLGNFYKITGEVKNNCDELINFVSPHFTLRDSSGAIIKTDFTYTSPTTIPAGETGAFEKEWCYQPSEYWSKDIARRPASYEIYAEGRTEGFDSRTSIKINGTATP